MPKITHISPNGIFIKDFISFSEKHFDLTDHRFYIFKKNKNSIFSNASNIIPIQYSFSPNPSSYLGLLKLIVEINKTEKIVLHGLNETLTIILLFLMPWNLKKCYWFVWGADIYKYKEKKASLKLKALYFFARSVVSRFAFIVVTVTGEFRKAQEWLGAKGKLYISFKYPSNFYKEYLEPKGKKDDGGEIKILLGNSASSTNNHEEALKIIKDKKPKGMQIKIFCPLSYGSDLERVNKVKLLGKQFFGDDFIPLTKFIPLNEYLNLLSSIDIAIFNHNRQQAMGSIITLLGLKKKVFIRNSITPWEFFREKNVKIFSINDLEFSQIDEKTGEQNQSIIKSYFSEERLKLELKGIFEGQDK